jgi:hypothetical protein
MSNFDAAIILEADAEDLPERQPVEQAKPGRLKCPFCLKDQGEHAFGPGIALSRVCQSLHRPPPPGGPMSSIVTARSVRALDALDARTAPVKRYRQIVAAITSDVGGDPSEARKQLIERAAFAALKCEMLDAQALAGEEIDTKAYLQLAESLRRSLLAIGLDRIAHEIGGNALDNYLVRKYGKHNAADDQD